ncbi:MAG: hypothetical protein U9R57_10730, partial [Thermodesulfobacteriota bacterium]|nr:hypothetical protein [Thermodesulfobacteriota bacterium]
VRTVQMSPAVSSTAPSDGSILRLEATVRYDGGSATAVRDVMVGIPQIFIDSDNDGSDDDWEQIYFGNLTTANQTSDFDRDGYTDLQEYLNYIAGETDPNGNNYDPTVPNAPDGTGYTSNSMNNGFWNLMLPAILSGSR